MRSLIIRKIALCIVFAFATFSGAFAELPIQNGDRIVAIGNSITVGGYYFGYIENYLRTRHPDWNLTFRCIGRNGNTAILGLNYIQSDVLYWNPTVAIVEWGMNDGRQGGAQNYVNGIVPYVDTLLAHNCRVLLCSNTPLDIDSVVNYGPQTALCNGTYYPWYGTSQGELNTLLIFDTMAVFGKGFAASRNIPHVDMFHKLRPLWLSNQHSPNPVFISYNTHLMSGNPCEAGDNVHPQRPGHLTMAYTILNTLGAGREVSFASVNPQGGVSENRRCRISSISGDNANFTFTRIDSASPCYVDWGSGVLRLVPFLDSLNWMGLSVPGLTAGNYEVRIDDWPLGTFTDGQLTQGINLCNDNPANPVYDVGKKIDAKSNELGYDLYAGRFATTQADRDYYFNLVNSIDLLFPALSQPIPHTYKITKVGGGSDQTPPTVTVSYPNGFENLSAGSSTTVRWTAADNVGISSSSIYYGAGNGVWNAIATISGNGTECQWTIPQVTGTYQVKVVVYDAAGNSAADSSDSKFQIAINPAFSSARIDTATIGSAYGYKIRYVNIPQGGIVTLTTLANPAWLTFLPTDTIFGTPQGGARTDIFQVTLSVNGTIYDTLNLRITIKPKTGMFIGNASMTPSFGIKGFSNGTIRYCLPADGQVSLRMINTRGEIVYTVTNGFQNRGEYALPYKNDAFAGGVYFLKLSLAEQAGGKILKNEIRKVVLLK